MSVFYADSTFDQYTANPFNANKPYDHSWVLFRLIEKAEDFQYLTTGGNDQVFRCIMTKAQKDWKYRINDFLQYEATYQKNIILAVNKDDIEIAKTEYCGHRYNDPFLRDYEQKVLVHTTTKENHVKIVSSGALKCWKVLKAEHADWEDKPIGSGMGDPIYYSNYVMFGTGGFYQEIITLSKQKGRNDMNVDGVYVAGARFYLNAESIANDGLLIRDGIHLKVEGQLPLDPYLFWTATPEVLGIPERTTPRNFADVSDHFFFETFKIPLEETCY